MCTRGGGVDPRTPTLTTLPQRCRAGTHPGAATGCGGTFVVLQSNSSTASDGVEPGEQLKRSWERLRGGVGLGWSPSDSVRREAASFPVSAVFLIPRGVTGSAAQSGAGSAAGVRGLLFSSCVSLGVFLRWSLAGGRTVASSLRAPGLGCAGRNATLQLLLPKTALARGPGGRVCYPGPGDDPERGKALVRQTLAAPRL